MSQSFHYGWEGVDTDLGTDVARLGEHGGYSLKAWAGEIGNCEVIFDDHPDAPLPDNGFEGHGNLWVVEDACAAYGTDLVNGDRIFNGYIGERTFGRGDATRSSLRVGSDRQVSVALTDLNVKASFRLLRGATANRPAETDVERVQWLLTDAVDWIGCTDDAGFVDTSNPVDMDAVDYTGQTPAQVLGDCATASGKNWFIGPGPGYAFLWYANSDTSSAYASLLSISNVFDDIDWGSDWTTWTVFPPKLGTDAKLIRTPDRRYKGVLVNFQGGTAYKTNSEAAFEYAWRDGSAPNGNVSTQTAADALAQRLADDAIGEEDRLSCSVQLPASLATGIKAGQRIQCRFSHLPGYEGFRWCRVVGLQIVQDEQTDDFYTLSLDLTPQKGLVFYDATVTTDETWHQAANGVYIPNDATYDFTLTITRASGAQGMTSLSWGLTNVGLSNDAISGLGDDSTDWWSSTFPMPHVVASNWAVLTIETISGIRASDGYIIPVEGPAIITGTIRANSSSYYAPETVYFGAAGQIAGHDAATTYTWHLVLSEP